MYSIKNSIKYYCTTYGDIYPGIEDDYSVEGYKIIVEKNKWENYNQIKEKNITSIQDIAWPVREDLVVKELAGNSVPDHPVIQDSEGWNFNNERKYLFIIGAGASANCVSGRDKTNFNNDTFKPPLGNELFQPKFKEIYKKYPGVCQSLNYLQDEKTDVEAKLENDWRDIQENGNEAIMSRHINIQYYLQELLRKVSINTTEHYYGSNLFAKLSDKLLRKYHSSKKRSQFAFVSFNQDTILETFLCKYFFNRELELMSIEDYIRINESPFLVFKPHGSWNWGWKFPAKQKSDILENFTILSDGLFHHGFNFYEVYYHLLGTIHEMADWQGYGRERSIDKHKKGKITIDKSKLTTISNDPHYNNNHYPAILLPYRDKDDFTMPPKHFHRMKAFLGYVDTLVIIGWKGNEDSFNRMLFQFAHNIRRIIIVDIDPKSVGEKLKPLITKGATPIYYDGGFEDFISNGLEKEIV